MGQGSAGRLASGRRWQGVLPLVSHHQGLGFRDFCRARGSQELMKKEEENCLPSPAACPGEGERRTVSLKTTLFCLFFFLHETASFYTKRAVSFKCGASKCFPNQSLIYPLFF
jgi:hypothetical protein